MTSNAARKLPDDGVSHQELPPGTRLLQGQYVIESYLNSGGFGITYLARDSLERTVVIKECFPASICRRDNCVVRANSTSREKDFHSIVQLFVKEARQLAKLDHPNIVGVHQVFEDNETAYMALDFVEGDDLLDIINDGHEALRPHQVRAMLLKMLRAVAFIHSKGILHRDISPDNILLEADGNPILIDFGAAREKATKATRALSALMVVKDGYSPQEFYVAGSEQGPPSDLYSLAATFYHVITGQAPPDSQKRVAAIAAREPDPYVSLLALDLDYDDEFLMAIDRAMNLFPKNRFQSAHDWIAEIDADQKVAVALAKARDDRHIERAISQLVEETNEAVLAEMEREIRELEAAEAARAAAASRPEPKKYKTLDDLIAEEEPALQSTVADEFPETLSEFDPGFETEPQVEIELETGGKPAKPHEAEAAVRNPMKQDADARPDTIEAGRLSFWRRIQKISMSRSRGPGKTRNEQFGRAG